MERSENIEDDFNKWYELTYNNYENTTMNPTNWETPHR